MWHGLKAGWDRLYKSSQSNGTNQPKAENGDSQPPSEVEELETSTPEEQPEAAAE
jgi:hypothetical protein